MSIAARVRPSQGASAMLHGGLAIYVSAILWPGRTGTTGRRPEAWRPPERPGRMTRAARAILYAAESHPVRGQRIGDVDMIENDYLRFRHSPRG